MQFAFAIIFSAFLENHKQRKSFLIQFGATRWGFTGNFSPNEEETGMGRATPKFVNFPFTLIRAKSSWSFLSLASHYSLKSRFRDLASNWNFSPGRFHALAVPTSSFIRSHPTQLPYSIFLSSCCSKPFMCLNRDYPDHFKSKSIPSMRFRRNGCRPVCVTIQSCLR